LLAPPLWIGAVICLFIGIASGRGNGELTVTWVPASGPPPSPPLETVPPAIRTVEVRLADLERLHSSGVLTDEEYAAKRAGIVADI